MALYYLRLVIRARLLLFKSWLENIILEKDDTGVGETDHMAVRDGLNF